jgi:uncharacterized protein (DUF4415 family)
MTLSKKRLEEIKAIQDENIDYSDIPKTDEDFWAEAEIKMPEPKKGVYIRLDPDILDWLKRQGKGYQARINAILRAYYEAHKNGTARH